MRFNIVTFGCKVNQYESNMMKEKMLSSNFLWTDNLNEADIIIINTCTVTSIADKKCLKMIRQIKRKYPQVILAVAGCSAQNNQDVYKGLGIDILIGNKDKSKIDVLINDFLTTHESYTNFVWDRNLEFEDMQIHDFNHVRAFIKIEDGCDNFCSYCIIPYVRGSVRSKSFEKIIDEAKSLAQNKHKEIVLTGINTGAYLDNGRDLTDLIKALSEIENIKRIRISSIEVTEITDKFLNMLKTNNKVCNHLHIPLQAGSDEILKKMNRKYDLDYFYKKIGTLRAIRPDISISTDVIVGHPYETDELFNKTLNFVKKVAFSKVHVFPYSRREKTASYNMPNQIDEATKKYRVKELIKVSDELENAYFNKFKGKTVDVLIEQCDTLTSTGHTSNYLKVTLNDKLEIGKIYSRQI